MGVNLKYIDFYAVLKRANDRKLHVFATKHEANTQREHLIHSHDDVSIWSRPPLNFMTSHETQELAAKRIFGCQLKCYN